MKRIDLDEWQLRGDRLVLLGNTRHRARNVLRIKKGESIVGTDGLGNEYTFTVTGITDRLIEGKVAGKASELGESPLQITLAQVVPRFSRMDFVIQKATELGVDKIVPLMTERSVSKLDPKSSNLKIRRWERIAAEAVAQCRRTKKPFISPPMRLKEFVLKSEGELKLVFHYNRDTVNFSSLTCVRPLSAEIVIGPEGGLAQKEMEICRTGGFIPVSLGPRVLRTETAGIVALALLQHRWGDMD